MGEKRIRLTPVNIFTKNQYKSILYLLIEFQDKEFQGKKGLKQVQLRYVLEKGYTDSDEPQVRNNIRILKEYFGEKLDALVKDGRVVRECIPSKQALTKILNNLKKHPINAIEIEKTRGTDARYLINKYFRNEGIRRQNVGVINNIYNNQILSFSNPDWNFKHICYGFSETLFNRLKKDEKEEVEKYLAEVSSIYDKIQTIRNRKIIEIWEKNVNKFINKLSDSKLKYILKSDTEECDIFRPPRENSLRGLLFHKLIHKIAFCHIMERTPTQSHLSEAVNDFFNDERYKHYKLEKPDIDKVRLFIEENSEFFINDVYPQILAFSSLPTSEFPSYKEIDWPKQII